MKNGLLSLLLIALFTSCGQQVNTEFESMKKEIQMKNETAEQNKQTVRQFFLALENKNVENLVALFAEDAKHINPYASGLFPEGANGKEGIRDYWTPVFPNFDDMTFPIEEIHAMEDPYIVFVKYRGRIQLKDGAGSYENDYYSTFRFDSSGLIIEYVEIFNPIVAARGFGLIDKIK